ncbi:MAG: cupredoxin family protein [Syntrophales bacterium]|nr:cupredoxin family protein [Syntrophales bacterium]
MKKLLIAFAVVLSLVSTGAFADVVHDRDKQQNEALGKPGDPNKVSRTIRVDMKDAMRFIPDRISIKPGETVRFLVTNSGKLKHEMTLGNMKKLKEHAELMRKFPDMEHADPNQITLDPGKSGEVIWQFTTEGAFYYGCLQSGHFEAGMIGTIVVKR